MEVGYTDKALEDILFWKKSGNKLIQQKISSLINAIENSPFSGIGSPEPLKHNLTGLWSRRINKEHRLVYEITEDSILIHSLKGHYHL
ncbi:MAG: Txe/YoeB family addiction module toxin [Ferruginibacter sp.]|nr:Txe/YoeB family addiction module toxin [Ferruginibacter sp.]